MPLPVQRSHARAGRLGLWGLASRRLVLPRVTLVAPASRGRSGTSAADASGNGRTSSLNSATWTTSGSVRRR